MMKEFGNNKAICKVSGNGFMKGKTYECTNAYARNQKPYVDVLAETGDFKRYLCVGVFS